MSEQAESSIVSASEVTMSEPVAVSSEIEGNYESPALKPAGSSDGASEELEKVADGAEQDSDDWEDLLGSGELLKKVMRKGEGISTRPTPQCRVKVRSRGRILESGDAVDKHSGYWFTVGDGDVVQAWDIAVTLMERGEVAKVKSAPRFAYGEHGKEGTVPGNATILYELELLEVKEPVKFDSLTEDELIRLVEKKKARGNELYQMKDYMRATNSYQKGLQAIRSYLDEKSIATDVPLSLVQMQIRCLNNVAAALMKVEEYHEALSACETVLQKDSKNVKALYRAGRVLGHLGEMDNAVKKLQQALALSPEDKAIQVELKKVHKKREKTLQTEKNMCRRMVGSDTATVKKNHPQKDRWGPFPYMAVAGATAFIAMGIAYFITQRQMTG